MPKKTVGVASKSFKDLLNSKPAAPKVEKKDDVPSATTVENKEFSQEELESAWKTCIQNYQNDPSLSVIVNQTSPIKKGNTISLELSSQAQSSMFDQNIRAELTKQLRTYLANNSVAITTTVNVQNLNTEAKLIEPKDCFDYLAEKNPKIQKFKDVLGLNID